MDLLRCLLLPLEGEIMMVPYSALAEVIMFEEPSPVKNAPTWLLGKLKWRDLEIPLICLEKMADPDLIVQHPNLHIAIFNRISANQPFDFVGVLLQSIPRMKRTKPGDLQAIQEELKPYQLMKAILKDEKISIPNISWIQESLQTIKNLQTSTAAR